LRDEELQLHCRRVELGIQSALESQRGESVRFFRLARIVTLGIVRGASAFELRPSLRALDLNLFSRLRQLKLSDPSLGLGEVDVSFRAKPVEERP
jgi:hypothetical protein